MSETMTQAAATENEDAGMEVAGVLDALAKMPAQALLTESAIAKALNVTPRTVRRMVCRHEIPPGVRLAGRSVWFAGRVLAWLGNMAKRAEDDTATAVERIRKAGA